MTSIDRYLTGGSSLAGDFGEWGLQAVIEDTLPENLFKAMGYFEYFYMEQLRKKEKNIKKFRENWPDISNSIRKDIKSLYSLNQARKTMRESIGLTLNDDIQVALERFMLMHNFLLQAKKESVKLTSEDKYLRKNSKKLNTSISNMYFGDATSVE